LTVDAIDVFGGFAALLFAFGDYYVEGVLLNRERAEKI